MLSVPPSNIEPPLTSTSVLNNTPNEIHPVPKSRPRARTGKKKNRTAIITDTPHKNMTEEEDHVRRQRQQNKQKIRVITESTSDEDLAKPLTDINPA